MSGAQVGFVRLTEVPLGALLKVLNEPRNARHMPLAGADFTEQSAAEWVSTKDAQWQANGYGPWAVTVDGRLAGWGGFQREDSGADFALVLAPAYWGHGAEIARAALDRAFGDLGLDEVVIALPHSRTPERAVARWGFVPDGEAVYDGVVFGRYRLTAQRWAVVSGRV